MSTTQIVLNTSTPLALAALSLLFMSGVMHVVARKRPNQTLKVIVHWGFILALTLGVLANISYLTIASFSREIRIAGTVRDEDGKGLGQAIVDVPGRGRGITDDYGAFEFSIPDSRKSRTYEGSVNLIGYGSANFKIVGPTPNETVAIKLTKVVYKANDFIQEPTNLMIGHYLGMPQIDIFLQFYNPTPKNIKLDDISIKLISPEQKTFEMPMVGTYAPIAIYSQMPLTFLELNPSQKWSLRYRFFKWSTAAGEVLQAAQQEYSSALPVPTAGAEIFSPTMANRFTRLMNQEMIWRAGKWDLVLSVKMNNLELKRSFFFTLTAADVTGLKSVSKFYQTGYSTLPATPGAPDGSSYIEKSLISNLQ